MHFDKHLYNIGTYWFGIWCAVFASKKFEADLDLIRLIFACFVFFAYLMYSLTSFCAILTNKEMQSKND
jgi:hypothetical protein